MKLQKTTKMGSTDRKRWYDDACGTAFALEMIGERWSILIMRELMLGPRRFNELRADLPGISANILTQRLERLESLGIVRRGKLPPPASVQIYGLTDWGYEAEPVILSMSRWSTRHPDYDTTLHISPTAIMISLRAMIVAERARGLDFRVGFRLRDEGFVAHVRHGKVDTERASPDTADALFECRPGIVASLAYGHKPIEMFEKTGELRVKGDRKIAEQFVTLFSMPEKIGEAGG